MELVTWDPGIHCGCHRRAFLCIQKKCDPIDRIGNPYLYVFGTGGFFMIVWSVQPKSVLADLEQYGTIRCDLSRSFNLSKTDSLKQPYQWLMKKMEERIGKRPEGVFYPIWAWHTWDFERKAPPSDSAAFLERTEDKVAFTLDIPKKEVVLTDFDAWQYVLNGWLLTLTLSDQKQRALETYLDTLNEKQWVETIEASWNLVFLTDPVCTPEYHRGKYVQATFWELKKEYIINKVILERKVSDEHD